MSAQAAVKRRACRNFGQGKGAFAAEEKRRMSFENHICYRADTAVLFITCYAYQLFYLAYMLVKKPARAPMASRKHRFGVGICARNEENVIGQLLSSVKAQDYPQELLEMFVVADNCTDATAAVARAAGFLTSIYAR